MLQIADATIVVGDTGIMVCLRAFGLLFCCAAVEADSVIAAAAAVITALVMTIVSGLLFCCAAAADSVVADANCRWTRRTSECNKIVIISRCSELYRVYF